MKKMLTLLLGLVSTFTSVSQNLDNTVWSFPPEKVTQLQGAFPGLDSVKIFFEFPDVFYTINYTNGSEATVFDGSYIINESNNTGQVVDSTDGSTSCNPIDLVTFDYSVLDTVLTFSNVSSPTCSIWQILIPGDYYLDLELTTNELSEEDAFSVIVYPNPSKDFIQFDDTVELIQLHDLQGKLIVEMNESDQLDIRVVPSGIYQLSLIHNNIKSAFRIIVE